MADSKTKLHPSRHSLRLPDYDYSQPGAYFITLITDQRICIFGEVSHGKMYLNEAGRILWEAWKSLPARYPGIELDEAVVMPDHFHGIIIVTEMVAVILVAAIHELPQQSEKNMEEECRLSRRQMLIPKGIGYLKMNTAKRINLLRNTSGLPVWQRNYYEHINRNEKAFGAIKVYIQNNPSRWEATKENLSNDHF
jgi:putative transposase